MADNSNSPIIVNPSSAVGQAGAAARYLLAAAGAYAIGKGYITGETLQAITTLATIIAPAAYGMYRTYANKQQLVVAASAAPNSVAKVQS